MRGSPKADPNNRMPESVKANSQQVHVTASMQQKDKEMIEWMSEYFDASKSEVVRTAVRHLFADLNGGRVVDG